MAVNAAGTLPVPEFLCQKIWVLMSAKVVPTSATSLTGIHILKGF